MKVCPGFNLDPWCLLRMKMMSLPIGWASLFRPSVILARTGPAVFCHYWLLSVPAATIFSPRWAPTWPGRGLPESGSKRWANCWSFGGALKAGWGQFEDPGHQYRHGQGPIKYASFNQPRFFEMMMSWVKCRNRSS